MAIPKVIHWCWFGEKALPPLARRCLDSWRRFAPDFEVRRWTLAELPPPPPFAATALAAKKWAFASDWARFRVIADHGGVYLDTDVELIRPIDDLIAGGAFFAAETDSPPSVNPGLGFAAEAGHPVIAEIAARYDTLRFDPACHLAQTCPVIVNTVLSAHPEMRVLPQRLFNPKNGVAGQVTLTDDTRAIHHYAASWFNWRQRLAYQVYPKVRSWLFR